MPKKYDLKAYPVLMGKITKGIQEAIDKGALSAGAKMVAYIQTVTVPATRPQPVDRGMYRAGWKFKTVKGGVYVYNRVLHAMFVEEGVKNVTPGKKLISALMKWVRRKGIGSRVVTNKKGISRVVKANAKRAKEIAYAIANGAKKKGGFFNKGRGLKVFKKSLPALSKIFQDEVMNEIKKELAK